MLEFIKINIDKLLAFTMAIIIVIIFAVNPTPDTKDLAYLIIGGFIGILTGGLKSQQNIIIPDGNSSKSQMVLDNINSFIEKEK